MKLVEFELRLELLVVRELGSRKEATIGRNAYALLKAMIMVGSLLISEIPNFCGNLQKPAMPQSPQKCMDIIKND